MSFAVRPVGASQERIVPPANVAALLHFDGANGSTTFTDSAGVLTWTRSGNAQISTAQSVFGGASGLFDGNGDYLTSGTSATLKNMLTQSFTVSGWVRPTDFKTYGVRLFCTGGGVSGFNATNGIQVLVQTGATGAMDLQIVNSARSASVSLTSSKLMSLNAWNHFVAQVDVENGLWGVGVNGVMEYAAKPVFGVPSSTPAACVATIPGEAGNSTFALAGHMDDLRVVVGTAIYTQDNYRVPTAPDTIS